MCTAPDQSRSGRARHEPEPEPRDLDDDQTVRATLPNALACAHILSTVPACTYLRSCQCREESVEESVQSVHKCAKCVSGTKCAKCAQVCQWKKVCTPHPFPLKLRSSRELTHSSLITRRKEEVGNGTSDLTHADVNAHMHTHASTSDIF